MVAAPPDSLLSTLTKLGGGAKGEKAPHKASQR